MTRPDLTPAQLDWVQRTVNGAHRDVAHAKAVYEIERAVIYASALMAVLWLLRGRV